MRRILLTGSNGFVGERVDSCAPDDVTVVRLDIVPSNSNSNAKAERFFAADLSCCGSLRDLDRHFDGIIHLGGVSRVSDGESDPLKCFQANMLGSINIFEFARKHRIRPWIILGSTIEPPVNMYGLSKRQMEQCAEIYSERHGLNILSLRFSNVFGAPTDNQEKLIPILIKNALRNEKLSIKGARQKENLIPVTEVAKAIWCGADYLRRQDPHFRILDICGGQALRRGELAKRIVELANSDSMIEILDTDEASRSQNDEKDSGYLPDPTAALETLGFQSNLEIDDQLRNAIENYRQLLE